MITQGRNNQAIELQIRNAPENAARGVRRGFHRLGNLEVIHSRKLIRKGPKTGRLYRIKGRKRMHRASAPGQAPANLTGSLARSIGYNIYGNEMVFATRGDESGPKKQANGGVPYGNWLDGGTRRIKPRPFLSATANHFDNQAETIFNDGILETITE
ncbi:MAG: hypothetical protein OEM38_00470 [Gammaproteobacteria bacterium]|nr:hypothetical protein [Gammaproteobacteria bacterium]